MPRGSIPPCSTRRKRPSCRSWVRSPSPSRIQPCSRGRSIDGRMNMRQSGPVLPFADFLDVLRSKGYGVGLNEHFALAQLLDRWDRTHAEELADAIAALIARNEEESQGVRQLFVEIYLEPAVTRAEPPAAAAASPTLRRRIWLLAPALAVALIVVAVWR